MFFKVSHKKQKFYRNYDENILNAQISNFSYNMSHNDVRETPEPIAEQV